LTTDCASLWTFDTADFSAFVPFCTTLVLGSALIELFSAKGDFPNETSALSSSVNALVTSAKALASSPSPSAIAQTAGNVAAVSTAVTNFSKATSSKCS
jgi:hypothetical protein